MTDNLISEKTAQVAALKEARDKLDAEADAAGKEFNRARDELLNMLDAAGIDSLTANGYLFFTEEKESVKLPEDLVEREKFFQYLRDNGMFESHITVHSATLNSLYKSLAEDALKKGILEFRIPGIEAPKVFRTLKLRAKRG